MIVKEAEEEDIASLLPIAKRLPGFKGDSELPFYLDTMGFELYVLEDEKKDIGFACVRIEEETEAEIDDIAISKDEEGKGKADFLLKEVLKELKEEGVQTVFLEVRSKNQRAISLYERNGFNCYRKRLRYYPDDDALCYLREEK
jgi:ribosomal-protein-alanine N-acetyltransferase